MKSGKILLSLVAGVAVGSLVGVLLAPNSGKETRRKIFKKGKKGFNEVSDKIHELIESLTDKMNHLKDEAKAITKNGQLKAEKIAETIKSESN